MTQPTKPHDQEQVIAATRRWLERAVIGLNLCPFAKAVHSKQQVRFVVTEVETSAELLEVLAQELDHLQASDPAGLDTTLLIHPRVLGDFDDYNWFIEIGERLLEELELDGTLQIAHFHPRFQFEGTGADDIGNFTNRSPYPTLHLLREDSVDRAVAAYPDPAVIYQRNIAVLERLGPAGWAALWEDAAAAPGDLSSTP